MKLLVVQRVVPDYRTEFFQRLGEAVDLRVAAGRPLDGETLAEASPDDVHVIALRNRYATVAGGWICWQAGALRTLLRERPDAVVIEANARILSNHLIVAAARARRTAVIGWGLGALPPSQRPGVAKVQERMRRTLVRRVDGVIAYSEAGTRAYVEMGVDPQRVAVAHNAVCDAHPEAVRQARAGRIAGSPVANRVLFLGRLVEGKGIDTLLEALQTMSRPVELLTVGDGPLRTRIDRWSDETGIAVHHAGRRSGSALSDAIFSSQVVVLPGLGGLAIQHALAHGRPVVVAEADGTEADLVRPGETGEIVPPGDVQGLAAAITSLLDDGERRTAMGIAGVRTVEERIGVSAMVQKYVAAVEQAAARRRSAGSR